MKKFLIIFLSVILCVLAAYGYFYIPKVKAAEVLPQGILFYAQAGDVFGQARQFLRTKFGQALRQVNLERVLFKSSEGKDHFAQTWEQIFSEKNIRLSEILFGREVTIAGYGPELSPEQTRALFSADNSAVLNAWFDKILIVTRLRPETQAAEKFGRILDAFRGTFSLATESYGSYAVRTAKNEQNGFSFAFCRVKDILIIALRPESIKKCLEVYSGQENALAQNSGFKEAQAQSLEGARDFVFFNAPEMARLFPVKNADPLTAEIGRQAGAFRFLTFSTRWRGRMEARFLLAYDPNRLPPDMKTFYACSDGENPSPGFIPAEVLFYGFSRCLDGPGLWRQFEKSAASSVKGSQEVNIGKNWGMSLKEDILPVFGPECGVYLTDFQSGQPLPSVNTVVFVQVKDHVKADKLLRKLTDMPIFATQEQEAGGVTLRVMRLPIPGKWSPAYAFLGDYLVFSAMREDLENAVRVFHKTRTGLSADKTFRAVNPQRDLPLTGSQFINMKEAARKTRAFLPWVETFWEDQDKQRQKMLQQAQAAMEEQKVKINDQEAELKQLQDKLAGLPAEISARQAKGEDAAVLRVEQNDLGVKIEAIQKDVAILRAVLKEYTAQINVSAKRTMTPEFRRAVLRDCVNPLLNALEFVKGYAAVTRSDPEAGIFMTNFFFELEK
ncbi:MAG: hypothetical protein HQL23_06270 [Candidatus Omnitrophica bacterium]|nr:hypothetical protein [Candidatus Omnitrophota bacterium]